MASAFSHAFVGLALGQAYARHRMPWHFWALSITCSMVPDADVLGFALGIPYASPLGHRGLSHSLCFAFVLSLCVVSLAFRQPVPYSRLWCSHVLYFFVVTASHGVLDAMTDGGRDCLPGAIRRNALLLSLAACTGFSDRHWRVF